MHEIYSKCQYLFAKINGVSPDYPLISMRANMHKFTFLCQLLATAYSKIPQYFLGMGRMGT